MRTHDARPVVLVMVLAAASAAAQIERADLTVEQADSLLQELMVLLHARDQSPIRIVSPCVKAATPR